MPSGTVLEVERVLTGIRTNITQVLVDLPGSTRRTISVFDPLEQIERRDILEWDNLYVKWSSHRNEFGYTVFMSLKADSKKKKYPNVSVIGETWTVRLPRA